MAACLCLAPCLLSCLSGLPSMSPFKLWQGVFQCSNCSAYLTAGRCGEIGNDWPEPDCAYAAPWCFAGCPNLHLRDRRRPRRSLRMLHLWCMRLPTPEWSHWGGWGSVPLEGGILIPAFTCFICVKCLYVTCYCILAVDITPIAQFRYTFRM